VNELELLLVRLEDLSESSDSKEIRTLAKALKRYFNTNEGIGFKAN